MSDTPYTDLHETDWEDFACSNLMVVEADRCRKLERDRALLLDALKTTLDCLEMNGFGKAYAMDQAREAIAKVEASK